MDTVLRLLTVAARIWIREQVKCGLTKAGQLRIRKISDGVAFEAESPCYRPVLLVIRNMALQLARPSKKRNLE
jgi:hypothetical protein